MRAGVGAALLVLASALRAQQPTVSPAVARLLQRDSRLAVWLFAWPQYSLDEVEAAVGEAGGTVRRRSEWLHSVSAAIGRAALARLGQSPLLSHIQPVAIFLGPNLPPSTPLASPARAPAATAQDSLYGPSAMPFRRLHLFPLVDRGFRGKGVRIAMLDTGFETGLAAFAQVKVIAQRDFVFRDSVVRNQAGDAPDASRHGTATWSLLAANVPGQLIGIAPEAEYILAKTEDVRTETRMEEDNYVAALEWADSLSANIVSSSLGYLNFDNGFSYTFDQLNGDFAVTTKAADLAAARGIAVVTAVGNSGQRGAGSLGTPADGDSVIAAGAEDSTGVLASFSSRGPTADGRIKPEVTAPGVQVLVLDTDPQCPPGFCRLNGTSFATPLVAGAAAVLRQIQPQLSGIDVRDALQRAGSNATRPDNNLGWGRPDVLVAATFPYGLPVASPRDTQLTSVTPLFAWSAPGIPSFGQPVRYHLSVARADTTASTVLIDTTLEGTQVTLTKPQRPGRRLLYTLVATAADSAVLTIPPGPQYVAPAWADLLTLDDPAGSIVRDSRPAFVWQAPAVSVPPGPFKFDVEVFRIDNREVVTRGTGLDSMFYRPATDLDLNTPYRWRVISHLAGDTATTASRGTFVVLDESVPTVTLLFQNFPNPFPNVSLGLQITCIWFDLARSGQVRLEILDLRGHLVRRLIPTSIIPSTLPAGRYGRPGSAIFGGCDPSLAWDGRTDDGRVVPQGVYLAKLVTPDGTFFKRIVFLGPG